MRAWTAVLALLPVALAQKPQFPPAFPPTPVLPSSINYAPSVTPNVLDPTAPDAQKVCAGYKAVDVQESATGLTAQLEIIGAGCNVYGNDIATLSLNVQYQSTERLAVAIVPKYLTAHNESQYLLSPHLTPQPGIDAGASKSRSDLTFIWSNEPSFQFKIARVSTGEVLFDTYVTVIVFEDQFLELKTSMVPDYNIYGLAETLHSFRLGNNFTQTFWNAYNLDNDQELDVNGHSTHPMYLETRYANGSSTSHGVYARNAHGQDWLLRSDSVTYRTIGGSFELYFLSGSTPNKVISQYQTGIVNTPYIPAYWHLGFHQVRWGYQNWSNLQDVVDLYAAQNIQLEGIMNDLDYLKMNRDFTDNPGHYDLVPGRAFLDKLHAAGQYYMPILDPNIYVPNPENASDAYPTYDRGVELDVYLRNGNDSYYYGVLWPGISAYPDFILERTQQFWTEQIKAFHDKLPFDGFWLDVSDATSFCTGSCGQGRLTENPIHVPFPLPGDPNTSVAVDFRYPEGFDATNATEAASAAASLASQSAAYPSPPADATPTAVLSRTLPTPGVRNLNFPPYAINNFLPGHSLVKQVIAPNATHGDGPYNSTENALHNLYGHTSGNATYNALIATKPGIRPFYVSRSTFAGSGKFAGHWGGDTNSKWGNMYFGISQALQFSIAGIPYFGVETCGFNGNADMELCTRWMQLSAWYPFYRNHNNRNTIAQEAYRWATTAESTRRIMNIRYSLLPYTYTLFHRANVAGETVLRALAWEFPDDEQLKAVETQFMSGPALLITPVLAPNALTVQGVFPGVATGTVWYDWYTLAQVHASPGENVTMDAPLIYQPIHVRGGYILPIQRAGNTTKTSRLSPWSLLVALDRDGAATGSLYLDDGISLEPNATKTVEFSYSKSTFTATVSGSYMDGLPLSNLSIAGFGSTSPQSVSVRLNGQYVSSQTVEWYVENDALYVTGLEDATAQGVWNSDVVITFGAASSTSTAQGSPCPSGGWPTAAPSGWSAWAPAWSSWSAAPGSWSWPTSAAGEQWTPQSGAWSWPTGAPVGGEGGWPAHGGPGGW